MGIDWGLVVPDDSRTLKGGAVKPWQTEAYKECQDDLVSFARRRGVPLDVPWRDLGEEHRRWVIEGEGAWEDKKWYGARGFFAWLESRSYRMHIRVLLSRYRAYAPCPACGGSRLKPEALLWKIGERRLSIHDAALLPIDGLAAFFRGSAAWTAPWTRRPGSCSPRCARASPTSSTSASATSRWTGSRAP